MSRVIKSAIWQEEPHYVAAPHPHHVGMAAQDEEESEGAAFDEAALSNMLAEIAAKEERANKLLNDAKISCDIMKAEAQQECDAMLAKAREEAAGIKNAAKSAGHDEGVELGRKEGEAAVRDELRATINEANAQAEHTLQTAKEAMHDYVQMAENDIATIAMQIVEKILPQHFIDVPQVILPLIRQALMKVKDQKEIFIHVAPDCYELVLLARDEFRSMLEGAGAVLEVKSDDSLRAGDCVLETPNGNVDARLATQLDLVKKAVQEVMK